MVWTGRGRKRYLAWTAACAVLTGLTAGCGGSSSPPAAAITATATPAGGTAGSTATGTAAASAVSFVPIVEPFDPGHPARARSAPASCASRPATLATEQCYQVRTENVDAAIDAVQQARYAGASAAQRQAILAQDSAWLVARQPVCRAAFTAGGTIDGVDVAACLLQESTARLDAVRGITPPEARLKSTDDSADPDALSWYTTPEGSRVAELDTQGDQTGGAVIAWIIIGGPDGFVVNPRQFYFSDGSFTDAGVIEPPNPAFHRVGTGVEYTFGIDYSHLSAAPSSSGEGFVYAPGAPVAIWQ